MPGQHRPAGIDWHRRELASTKSVHRVDIYAERHALEICMVVGFGLPLFEAAYSKLPVVAPGWSGHMDFLVDEDKKEHFYNVSFDIQPVPAEAVWEGVITKESMWAYPREQSAKEKMRECYEDMISENPDSIAAGAAEYSDALERKFTTERMYAEFVDAVVDKEEYDVEEWLSGLNVEEIA